MPSGADHRSGWRAPIAPTHDVVPRVPVGRERPARRRRRRRRRSTVAARATTPASRRPRRATAPDGWYSSPTDPVVDQRSRTVPASSAHLERPTEASPRRPKTRSRSSSSQTAREASTSPRSTESETPGRDVDQHGGRRRPPAGRCRRPRSPPHGPREATPATHPSCTSLEARCRSWPVATSISDRLAAVPRVLAGAVRDHRDDRAVAAPVGFPDVAPGGGDPPDVAGGHVDQPRRSPLRVGEVRRLDVGHPGRHVGCRRRGFRSPRASACSAASPATPARTRVPSADHRCHSTVPGSAASAGPRRSRCAPARTADDGPSLARSDRKLSRSPSGDHRGSASSLGPCVTCRSPVPSASTRQMRPTGWPSSRSRRSPRNAIQRAVGGGRRVARRPRPPEPRLEHRPEERFDLLEGLGRSQVAFHRAEDRARPASLSADATTLGRRMGTDSLVIHGAREHNLKNVTLELPRDRLIVFTGLSGSGKSSLAFDTIYAEGQRRYVESLSAYARQFLGQMEKPDVDFIEGLSPAISIDQKSTSRNPRSTVGTITEVYDYLRVLYARVGHPHCYNCGRPIGRQTPDQIVDQVMELPEGTRFQVLAPVVRGRKGEYGKLLDELARKGFPRARIDGEVRELTEPIRLAKTYKHTIEVVVDRLVAKPDIRRRVADSIETALELAEGIASIAVPDPRRRRGDPELLAVARVHPLRPVVRRDGPAQLLVQLAVRGLPDVRRARHPARGRPRARGARPRSVGAPRERWLPGRARPSSTGTACSMRSPTPTTSISRRRSGGCRRRSATCCCTAATSRSTCGTRTGTGGNAPTGRPTRAWSPTSSGGTARPTRRASATSSSSSCARSRAERARGRACGRRRSR